jgi:hypothetical protein
MSDFGKPKGCINGCGATIYFDAHSMVGHPRRIPLEFKEGRKTDQVHDCPKKKQSLNGNGNGSSTPTVVAKETPKVDLNNLNVIRVIAAALEEYIAMKEAGK